MPDHLSRAVLRVAVCAALAAGLTQMPRAGAQAFSEAQNALVDYSQAPLTPAMACAALIEKPDKTMVEVHATSLPAQGAVPAQCRIRGLLWPEIDFEVSLPANWNGRFFMFGNGGLAGESIDDRWRGMQRDAALAKGFAVAQTNTGHDAHKEPGGSFVLSNPQKAIDYAYAAVHQTAITAKALTARYYARPVSHAYWNSCSNGGRQGLIEAQRYPQDFDGVVVDAPWVDQTGFTMGILWNAQALDAAPLTAPKLKLLAQKVMERCDAIDGLKDGLIDDPRRCDFDAHRDVPACPAGSDKEDCLTAAQADTIMKIYGGPRSGGRTLFPGYMFGSEALTAEGPDSTPASSWADWIVPMGAAPARNFDLGINIMRYLVLTPPQPGYDYHTFDFDRDPPKLAAWGAKVDARQTDLSKFRARGGKLLMTYGWADQILQPLMGVQYYEKAVARNGAHTSDFFRLFMVPGMAHCSGGNGPDRFDSMTAMVNWVEKGKAPDQIVARQLNKAVVLRSRPLCPYPQVARYSGQGSTDEAANFRCVKP